MKLRFGRNEWSGSFGDIGTDFPLMVGIIAASGLDAGAAFTVFGALQILSGFYYRLPMPLQPLKAMAVIIISTRCPPSLIAGGAFAVALLVLFLTVTGFLRYLARLVPLCIIRGIQMGLALSLIVLVMQEYLPAHGVNGYAIAGAALVLMFILLTHSPIPAGLVLVVLGLAWAIWQLPEKAILTPATPNFAIRLALPAAPDIIAGLVALALPQLPLSLANSIFATRQACADFFPQAKVSVTKIGITYALNNLVAALTATLPVCHGCGGLAGHYAFGARTGGSVIIYGGFFLLAGCFFGAAAHSLIAGFPLPLLGAILIFEALSLARLCYDLKGRKQEIMIASMVALVALLAPYGYALGMVAGSLVYHILKRRHRLS